MGVTPVLAASVLCLAFAITNGLPIDSGVRYYIRLTKTNYCSDVATEQYLSFTNRTCEAGTKTKTYGPTIGPYLNSGNKNYAQWTVDVKSTDANGHHSVVIKNYYPKNKGTINCLGNLVVEKPSLCTTERLVDKVHIHPESNPQQWTLVPDVCGDGSYYIIANSRPEGCLRYLSATGNCEDNTLVLNQEPDEGSCWFLDYVMSKPTPSPSPGLSPSTSSPNPSPPDAFPKPSPPHSPGDSPPHPSPPGSSPDPTPPNSSPDLSPSNSSPTPSSPTPSPKPSSSPSSVSPSPSPPVSTRGPTPVKPGKPTKVDISACGKGCAALTWVDGSEGLPLETYSVLCVSKGAGCNAASIGTGEADIDAGIRYGTVEGLTTDEFSCYVVAENSVGSVCSSPVAFSIPKDPELPGKPTKVVGNPTEHTIKVTWNDGTAGDPEETYSVFCSEVDEGINTCTEVLQLGPNEFSFDDLARGTEEKTVRDLKIKMDYVCFVIASNAAGSVCSDKVRISTDEPEPVGVPDNICNGKPVDLDNDPAHCGGCNIACDKDNCYCKDRQRYCTDTNSPVFTVDENGYCGRAYAFSGEGGRYRAYDVEIGKDYSLYFQAYSVPDRFMVRDGSVCGEVLVDTGFRGQGGKGCAGSAPCCKYHPDCIDGVGGACPVLPEYTKTITPNTGFDNNAGVTVNFKPKYDRVYIMGYGGCTDTGFEYGLRGAGGATNC